MVLARYANRADGGRRLAEELAPRFADRRPVVLGLPRGGVPVAAEVSTALDAPLDVLVVRKLPTPGQPELALGAVGEGGVKILNRRIVAALGMSDDAVADLVAGMTTEVTVRLNRFRGDGEGVPIEDRDIIIVDDGMATGASMLAAIAVARAQGAGTITVAVPVAGQEAATAAANEADELVVLSVPRFFRAVGEWFADFDQVSEAEVIRLLATRRPR